MTDDPRGLWDPLAAWWKDTFTRGADPEYQLQILPLVTERLRGARRVLDIGCGEGQVTRALLDTAGVGRAAGVDPSRAQLANALAPGSAELGRGAGGTAAGTGTGAGAGAGAGAVPAYLQAQGEALPFADASFDGIVCCLAIEHAADADAVLAEVARVLEPGGRFLLLVNHPVFQGTGSGFVDDRILGERYWRVGPYLVEDVSWEHVDAGVELPFAHRPLSRYLNPLAERDVLLVHMDEPAPHPDFLAASLDPALEAAIPRLLGLLFERRPRAAVPARPTAAGGSARLAEPAADGAGAAAEPAADGAGAAAEPAGERTAGAVEPAAALDPTLAAALRQDGDG